MMNSITAAQHSHMFLYRGWEVKSMGNPYAHAILRGYVDAFGRSHANYHYEDLTELYEIYQKSGLQNPAVILPIPLSSSIQTTQTPAKSILSKRVSQKRSCIPAVIQATSSLSLRV